MEAAILLIKAGFLSDSRKAGKCCVLVTLLAFVFLSCAANVTDQELVAKDHRLLQDFRALQVQFEKREITGRKYSEGLSGMHSREEIIFAEARRHNFTDMQAGNYFFRSRLKFPSPIEEAQKKMAEADTK